MGEAEGSGTCAWAVWEVFVGESESGCCSAISAASSGPASEAVLVVVQVAPHCGVCVDTARGARFTRVLVFTVVRP